MILVGLVFDLPIFCYLLDLWSIPLFFALPTMPSLLLAKAAFLPVSTGLLVYSAVYGTVAAVVALVWARRSFQRFVASAELA